ncbi:energy-coupling factor ABC transporter ATP-binding protein [Konateibacter massiliensis]|uniref:energy-coupling factor ABC transporter ATP-binding protein n=1 Tax=Konateibacter massiliensis TaxID=2002841 RepID=UPI0015D5231C|nr:ABC transporter ATP-binding protein [Konateibacter massiliensis]
MSMTKNVLKVEHAHYSYEEGRYALHNINVDINEGEKIAVIGSNGAGKSTFFLALNGVVKLSEGDLYFHGEKLDYTRKNLLKLRKSVGMVFQNPDDQIIASTVEGEISFGLFNIGMKQEEVRTKVDSVMQEMNLTEYAKRPPHFLSGGEKKRITIADVLVMEPEIILFDEPTASLDCKNIALFREQIDRLHEKGVTLLVSTHDMNFVWEWAERVIVFAEGEIIADDIPAVIFENDEILSRASLQKPLLFEYEKGKRKS